MPRMPSRVNLLVAVFARGRYLRGDPEIWAEARIYHLIIVTSNLVPSSTPVDINPEVERNSYL